MTLTPFSPLSRIDALIVAIAESGRAATEDELREIAAYVAAKGFDPTAMRKIGGRAAGVQWQGHVYQGGEICSNEMQHFLVHVLAQHEWPAGTTPAQYVQSLQDAVNDFGAGIHSSRTGGIWQLNFFAPLAPGSGPRGKGYMLVGYRPTYGWWLTGFPIASPLSHIAIHTDWQDGRWLRLPK